MGVEDICEDPGVTGSRGNSIRPNLVLTLVSFSVFLASSTWFSGTSAALALRRLWVLNEVQCSWLTISVQLGFIAGTFLYAILNLADLFNARRVFFISALMGAVFNAVFAGLSQDLAFALVFRVLTGLALAGVYPVGMKIIAQWFRSGLGWRLGVMVGALTLGTACPYFFFAVGIEVDWQWLSGAASLFSLLGGLIVLLGVPDGPYLRKFPRFDARMAFTVFKKRDFRLQAFGYFGHMWELYTFWSLSGSFLYASLAKQNSSLTEHVPLIAFFTIGIGAGSCVAGGWLSRIVGEKPVALVSLCVSGILCLFSGFFFGLPPFILIPAVLVWGFFVISDSPQFSALAAKYCPPEYTGTALTIQNGIGFGITVISIQITALMAQVLGWQWAFTLLAVGPILGVLSTSKLRGASL